MSDPATEIPNTDRILTDRLELRPMTRDELDAVALEDHPPHFHPEFPTPDAADHLRSVAESGEFFYTESVYGPLACVERASGTVVGVAGWVSPPIEDSLELVGFLVPSVTGQGLATEAIHEVVRLGFRDPRVQWVRASVPEESAPLGRFLERCGFEEVTTDGSEAEYRIGRDRLS